MTRIIPATHQHDVTPPDWFDAALTFVCLLGLATLLVLVACIPAAVTYCVAEAIHAAGLNPWEVSRG